MKTKELLEIIEKYDIETNQSLRFWQILFNLWITEFAKNPPEDCGYLLKDIYNDSNEVIANRILQHKDSISKVNNTIYK